MALFNQTFTNQASQFGMPLFGVATIAPFTGNYFWVDPVNGSDGNTGGPQDPFRTLTQAHTVCVAGNNDVVFLTGTANLTTTLNWSKNSTHLIGLGASLGASIAQQAGASLFTPLVNVTAQGCIFKDLKALHGFNSATTQICWAEAGGGNSYQNVKFFGMNNATAAAQAGSRSLTVSGVGDNLFTGCMIGLDTVVRATGTNTSLEFLSSTPRNIFRNCIFQANVTNAADTHIAIGATGIGGFVLLDNCSFLNAVLSVPVATTMTASITADVAAGGVVLVQGGSSFGATSLGAGGIIRVNMATAAANGVRVIAAV